MFSNLSAGSVLYVLDTRNKLKLTTGQINSISAPRPKMATFNPGVMYGQNVETVLDITATIDGEKREFKQVPSNTSVANFGVDAFILADSREAMLSQVNTMLQNSQSIISSIDKHKALIKDCKAILIELNPSLAAEAQRDSAITNLQDQVNLLSKQLGQLVSALNIENKKQ